LPELAEVRLLFAPGSAELSDTVRAQLDQVAEHLLADEEQRIVLLAYADGKANQASHARRLSLTRALAVRTHFIDLGIRSSRIEVRPLGREVPDDDPADRGDIRPAQR
jgi:outer membrane protein OmpA-like peptidoglycan-associated protein